MDQIFVMEEKKTPLEIQETPSKAMKTLDIYWAKTVIHIRRHTPSTKRIM